ncbi:ATP-binding protein [Luedemannella helvata]|uniref:LuxR family transcriptional regulator n=1 Tax=Luedemannella helvata TaxID=349315 RepID=A0ABN2JTF8_9ACTN
MVDSPPPVLGRDRERATLRRMIDATSSGAGGGLVITGQPGIGKTRLLADARAHARAKGLAVGSSEATEIDQVAPLSTLLTMLRRIGPVPLDLPRLDSHQGERFWYVERIAEALENYVAQRPLLLILDDAQWTDEFSVLALRSLVPAFTASPLCWLISRRPVPARTPVQDALDWLREQGSDEIVLGQLDERAVSQLCASVLGAHVDATVLALAERGAGNPFLIKHLLRTLQDTGQIVVSDGVATVVGDELPTGFYSAVDQRLRGLAPDTRRLLQAGAVLGRPFALHTAATLLGVRGGDLSTAAEEAVGAGLLAIDGDALVFGHDLIREAVYNGTSAPVRSAMHREAMALVHDAGGSPVETATHLIRSGTPADRSSVDVLRQAAAEVADRAPGTAASLIVWALERLDPDDEAYVQLSADAVGLLASAGRLAEARAFGEAALRRGLDATTEATLLLGLAEALKHAGNNEAAVEYAARGLAAGSVPDAVRAQLYAVQAHALMYDMDDVAGVDRAGTQAYVLGGRAGEHAAAAYGLAARTLAAHVEGRLDDALAHARAAVEIAERFGGAARHRHPRIWLGVALTSHDLFAEADETYSVGRREADELGTAWSQPLWHYYHAVLLGLRGDLDEAQAEAEAGLRIADQLTARQLSVPLLGLLARLATVRDQLPAARDHIRDMQALLDDGVTAAPEDVAWTRAVFADADDDPSAALVALRSIVDRFPGRLLLFGNDPAAAPMLVRTARQTGERDVARATVAAAERLADAYPVIGSLAGAARHAAGLLRTDVRLLRDAVARLRDVPRPLALASALEDTAVAEYAAGSRSRAVDLLGQADEIARRHGATRVYQRLERRMQTFGAGTRGDAVASPAPMLASLTRAEYEVARLVASGATNRQVAQQLFISPHTVDSHLRHIFGKLGINKRVELARLVARAEDDRRP